MIDGQMVATQIKQQIAKQVNELAELGVTPGLAVIMVGNDAASEIYVKNKQQVATDLGIEANTIKMPADTTELAIIKKIQILNEDPAVDAILVQSPMPTHINEQNIQAAIDPSKDVDGFHPYNLGQLVTDANEYYPVANTPRGIMRLLKWYDVKTTGKLALVIGRSILVGKPIAAMLTNADATVITANSQTKNLDELIAIADIVVVAMGKANAIDAQKMKAGATLIDVGINRLADGTLVGDVANKNNTNLAFTTPVPGGVGPMTIATLMETTVELAQQHVAHGND